MLTAAVRWRMRGGILLVGTLLLLLGTSEAAGQAAAPLVGRWQYLQSPDKEGEILDLSVSSGRWRGIMNGLERAGEHGRFYYVVAVDSIALASTGIIRFEVGERFLSRRRPALSALGSKGDAGVVRYRMRFIGRIEAGELVLRCTDAGGSCPDSLLRFKKISSSPEPNQAAEAVAARRGIDELRPRVQIGSINGRARIPRHSLAAIR